MFKSFFIHKILVHQKKKKFEKSEESENSKKFKDIFEDLKSVHPIWE